MVRTLWQSLDEYEKFEVDANRNMRAWLFTIFAANTYYSSRRKANREVRMLMVCSEKPSR